MEANMDQNMDNEQREFIKNFTEAEREKTEVW